MLVHEGDGQGLFGMQCALVSVTPVHGVDHVSHLLTGVAHGVFALLCKLAAKANTRHLSVRPAGTLPSEVTLRGSLRTRT